MKRKKDNNPQLKDEEDFGFLDDRIQLLDTIRDMIDIELERRGMKGDNTPLQQPPRDKPPSHGSSCREFLERLKRFFHVF